MKRFIPYGRHNLNEEDIQAVVDILRGDLITQGPMIEQFEAGLADAVGARYAVVVSSGTAALHAAYHAVGLGAGKRLITSTITFVATANAARFVGAEVQLGDVERETGLIEVADLVRKVDENTLVIAPVHLAGQPADMKRVREIAADTGASVVEDAAHGLGAEYWDEGAGEWAKVGSCRHSDMAIFSFHPVKHITMGEGGAITTNSEDLYQKLRMFRSHGVTRDRDLFLRNDDGPWYYEAQEIGYNYRVTDFQCALGLSQLRRLDQFVRRRREIAAYYDHAFMETDLVCPLRQVEGRRSSYHIYVVLLNLERLKSGRREIFDRLLDAGLGVNLHYIPLHRQPFYARLPGSDRETYPGAEDYYRRAITLPLFPAMSDEDVQQVVDVVMSVTEMAAR